jgi:uncharacterized membrane protein
LTRLAINIFRSVSIAGLVGATLCFCLSLTPSLMPRSYVVQGLLSGSSAAVGYGLGLLLVWLWTYMELPGLRPEVHRKARIAMACLALVLSLGFLRQAAEWQNSIRALMGLAPVDTADPFKLIAVTLVTLAIAILAGYLFKLTVAFCRARIGRFVPRRVALVVSIALTAALMWSVTEGVLFKGALRMADTSFQEVDALMEDETPMPTDPGKTGSAASLIRWKDLGRQGRNFVSSGPGPDEFRSFAGAAAAEPLRVYVGLNAAETPEARARLALDELKRSGGFDRSVLVVIVPTGTGWVDPAAVDTLEYLHRGDVATVAVQYSYLASWMSLMVEPAYGSETARALFKEVYGYWTTLPRDRRPRLYLHGLSLGALNSQLSADLYDVIADPFQGALWSGPPFSSTTWASVTASRNAGSPAWLPTLRDGSIVRFTDQQNRLEIPGATWGPIRVVYLQYASDPVTFFDWRSLYREPAWLKGERGPDVSPSFRWVPVVTMLQLGFDAMIATTSPMGHGHVYAPEHYIDAWLEVTQPEGWNPEDIERLKTVFRNRFADQY